MQAIGHEFGCVIPRSLARPHASGDYQKAESEMKAALAAGPPDTQRPGIAAYLKRLEAAQGINN
jgi:hypothetical protein